MLSCVSNFYPARLNNIPNNNNNVYRKTAPLQHDTFTFKGMSSPSQYKTVFGYLAADLLCKQKKFGVDGSLLSAGNIAKGVEKVFDSAKVYETYTNTNVNKIKWKEYVPQDVREYCVDKINAARTKRLDEWKNFLESPEKEETAEEFPKLVTNVKKNKSLRLIVWNAVTSELKDNNRHIPVPFNAKALAQTVKDFESIEPKSRAVRCASPTFLEMYTHRLRDNLLEDKGLSDNKSVWVKIPSIKKDLKNKDKNISELETLSCKNWCTRSSVDKAEAALEEGDFYIYLERGKNNLWQPLIGMASHQNKIDQIQGVENNNVIPLNQLSNVKNFIQEKGLKCSSGIIDEGPKAYQEILISEKLMETRPELEKSFEKAIKDEDSYAIFKYLDKPITQNSEGKLIIGSYKPSYVANANSGITIPYNMMGINEDALLENVQKINGDLILDNKNKLFKSSIRMFPKNLEEITGKVVCSKEQYEKFGKDIERVVNTPENIIIHNSN